MSIDFNSNSQIKLSHQNQLKQIQLIKESHQLKQTVQRTSKKEDLQFVKKNFFLAEIEKLEPKNLIKQLKNQGGIERNKLLSLLDIVQSKLKHQPNVLRVSSPAIIIGDIHGQFFDLLNIFERNGFPDKTKFLFLGDYVDRGLFCIQTITLLFFLKVKYPQNILLLRGNHEGKVMTMNFNFRFECTFCSDKGQKKYGIQIYERFLDVFCKLPLCAVIDQMYFAVHGGISPEINKIKQLDKINRFVQITGQGVVCDLVWSDPSEKTDAYEWESNSTRGCSYYYGRSQAKSFLKKNKIKMIVRGHQVQIEGYGYQKAQNGQKLTLTIFSAPNYCDVYKNKGAFGVIRENKFVIQKFTEMAHPFVLSNYMNCFQFSMPGVFQAIGKVVLYFLKSRAKKKQKYLGEQNIFQQLNALKRIEEINEVIEKIFVENEFILFQSTQFLEEKTVPQSEYMNTSFKISFEAFNSKKQNDQNQKYPTQKVIQTVRERKKTKKITLNILKSTQRFIANEMRKQSAFGPKLDMKNYILKKDIFKEQEEISEQF